MENIALPAESHKKSMVHSWVTEKKVDSGYQEMFYFLSPMDFYSRSHIDIGLGLTVICKHTLLYSSLFHCIFIIC